MSFQSLANRVGLPLIPTLYMPQSVISPTATAQTIDAVGESVATIGQLVWSSGPGTSKTISSAGGAIYFTTGSTITFANASTNLRAGIQDVNASGIEDGIYDVRGDIVGGSGLSANSVRGISMSTGSKTITHGDIIAVVVEMTARGGTDSIQVRTTGNNSLTPYRTLDTGSGPSKAPQVVGMTIVADDGTVGWFTNVFAAAVVTSADFNSGSTPDEYALVFQLPCPATASAALIVFSGTVGPADDFEVILYSDPLGTPVAERTLVIDASFLGETVITCFGMFPFTSNYDLLANTSYAVALRPTTVNGIGFNYLDFGSGNGAIRAATMIGTNWSQYSRTNQSGAFSSQDITKLPNFGLWLSAFDDGASGGGSSIQSQIFGG